jgi:hypothetical protein
MPHKEAGVLYLTACPGCGDELALGWLPKAVDLPHLVDAAKRRLPWRGDAQGLAVDPVTCHCGAVTLAPAAGAPQGRVAVTWSGSKEPSLRVIPQYGSIRDRVT